jgi:hypothetical protein
MWGGMFLLAYAGGSALGRFTTSGLVTDDSSLLHDGEAANFWAEQDKAREAGEPARPAQRYAYETPGNHACDGCDAHITRDKQMAAMMGLPYDDPREAVDTERVDMIDVPPPPVPARP